MLFLSTFENKIDAKGRVSVPATFRATLIPSQFSGVILYPSFTAGCIEGVPFERMQQLSESTDNLDLFSEQSENLASLLFASSREAPFDSAGRISIPPELLKSAGITDKALFVGKGKTFQIWERKNFEAHQKKVREQAKTNRPTLNIKAGTEQK